MYTGFFCSYKNEEISCIYLYTRFSVLRKVIYINIRQALFIKLAEWCSVFPCSWWFYISLQRCEKFLSSSEIAKDKDGTDEQCRWCGEGGRLVVCDDCASAFCKACVMRNFNRSEFNNISKSSCKFWLIRYIVIVIKNRYLGSVFPSKCHKVVILTNYMFMKITNLRKMFTCNKACLWWKQLM